MVDYNLLFSLQLDIILYVNAGTFVFTLFCAKFFFSETSS